MFHWITAPWPWYLSGPLLGAVALALLLHGNRLLGVSGSYRVVCAAVAPRDIAFFRFDWRAAGAWNLLFALGLAVGGFVAVTWLGAHEPATLSAATRADLAALGIAEVQGLVPPELFSWSAALSPRGLVALVFGGLLVGFGAAYAGGCTSGHGIMGLADLQLPSLVAVAGFFAGGLTTSYFVLPLVL